MLNTKNSNTYKNMRTLLWKIMDTIPFRNHFPESRR